ncbi:MAG: hypothetical protein ACXV7I_12070 [Ilumatobacteraceae bacterium]
MTARLERALAAAFVLVIVGLSWGMAQLGGAVGVPRTGAWAYELIALDLHSTGHIHLVGYGQMTLVGLAAWAQPWLWVFGQHRWVLELSSSALFAAGLYGAQRLARVLLSFGASLFVVACVAAYPGVLRDASSFMTDGPALGLHLLVLVGGLGLIRATVERQPHWLALVGLLGFFAFSVRELTFAAPAAVLAMAIFSGQRVLRRRAIVTGAVLVVGCVAFWGWRHSLPGGQPYDGPPGAKVLTLKLVGAVLAIGLGLAPVIALTWRRWWPVRHRVGRIVGMSVGMVVVAIPAVIGQWSHEHVWWFLGDYFQANGINGDKLVSGRRPRAIPRVGWDLLVAMALVATVVVVMLVVEWATDSRARLGAAAAGAGEARTVEVLTTSMLLWHDAGYAVLLGVAAVGNGAIFDRYLWPLLISAAIVILHRFAPGESVVANRRSSRRSAVGLGGFLLAGMVVTSLSLTANSDAFDGARWKAATEAVDRGSAPIEVDAGFEWLGTYHPNLHCIWVVPSRLAPGQGVEVATLSYRPLLIGSSALMYVYRVGGTGCPPV